MPEFDLSLHAELPKLLPPRTIRTRQVSTVDERWARTSIRNEKASCQDHAADGVAVFKRRRGKWRFVTAGGSFDCPVPDVPGRIAKDLKIPCRRGWRARRVRDRPLPNGYWNRCATIPATSGLRATRCRSRWGRAQTEPRRRRRRT